ncbi:MAG: threonine/serine dehydratase [Pseudomonadota bacterium]
MSILPTFKDIAAAHVRLEPYLLPTPLLSCPQLDRLVGGTVLLKPENLQRKGAFKFRGAFNAASMVDFDSYPGGLVACSSGNHAQGTAEAARLLGVAAHIVMPKDAPAIKQRGVITAGGTVVPYERGVEDRYAKAAALADELGAAFIPPFDHHDVIAGQGTIGIEILTEARALGEKIDCILVPTSGGGLVSGIALAAQSLEADIDVRPVEPVGHDDFAISLERGTRCTAHVGTDTALAEANSTSLCDALLTPMPGELTFAVAQERLGPGLSVDNDAVLRAMRFVFEELKLVVEPGGAAALAAVIEGKIDLRGLTCAVVLSGGNVDGHVFAKCFDAQRVTPPKVSALPLASE